MASSLAPITHVKVRTTLREFLAIWKREESWWKLILLSVVCFYVSYSLSLFCDLFFMLQLVFLVFTLPCKLLLLLFSLVVVVVFLVFLLLFFLLLVPLLFFRFAVVVFPLVPSSSHLVLLMLVLLFYYFSYFFSPSASPSSSSPSANYTSRTLSEVNVCAGGKVWVECGAQCQKTCKNMHIGCSSSVCQAGCVCPPGQVEENGTCVLVSRCPCHFNGKSYENGESIKKDCNTWWVTAVFKRLGMHCSHSPCFTVRILAK